MTHTRPKSTAIHVALTVAWATTPRGPHLLVARRPEGKRFAGLTEWPGGRVEPGESPAQAALRELHEETGIQADPLRAALLMVHVGAGPQPIRFHVHLVEVPHMPEPRPLACDHPRWLPASEALRLRFPPDNLEINRRIQAWLRESRRATPAPDPSAAP